MNSDHILALAAKRFVAVDHGDVDACMSLLVDEPVFDLYPVGLRLSGQDNVRNYYSWFLAHGAKLFMYDHVALYHGDDSISFELDIRYTPQDGEAETYRLLAIMSVEGDRFTGERLFGDERLFKVMFGEPTWQMLTPIKG